MNYRVIFNKSKYVIRDYMKKANLSYRELAKLLNVSHSYIYAVINDKKTVDGDTARIILETITDVYYSRVKL